jgi:hypothetical protein
VPSCPALPHIGTSKLPQGGTRQPKRAPSDHAVIASMCALRAVKHPPLTTGGSTSFVLRARDRSASARALLLLAALRAASRPIWGLDA